MTQSTTAELDIERSAPALAPRLVVAAGALVAIVGAAWGAGAFGGTPIEEAADGALAADATLLAPATPAFGIWSPIYLGLAVFAVVQALPATAALPRVRAVAWHLLAAMLLNAAWIAVVQAGLLWASVGVLVAIVATLSWAAVRLTRPAPRGWIDAVAVDVPTGLYLGWASVATVANLTTAGAVQLGAAPEDGTYLATAVVAAVALLVIAMVRDLATAPVLAWAVAGAAAWGLAWIGDGRLRGEPADAIVGWAALGAAGIVLLAVAIATAVAAFRARRRA
ncbi:tryptophan-rich sensory protein [Demequina sp. SYSU T00068]|uniref:tryptophan-rich sensory protein n=1 Tax=Demequina lignilytica TaxID=3051663 RepID=UPI002616992F|nr:tryptophan-rich sensory protein [Demequina sp. SYSU T00068]MDN4489478.1 tryptophan-rich sensory protein [Demequina sp. SYSU T00068]